MDIINIVTKLMAVVIIAKVTMVVAGIVVLVAAAFLVRLFIGRVRSTPESKH